jgi:chromosome segregation ATPase
MNSDEAEARVRAAVANGDDDTEALCALLDFYEQNAAIIQDRDRELADLQEQLNAVGNEADAAHTKAKELEHDNAKLREEAQTARLPLDVALKEIERLKAENAALLVGREQSDFFLTEDAARLKWFEEREPLMKDAVWAGGFANRELAIGKLEKWRQENPPPGAAVASPSMTCSACGGGVLHRNTCPHAKPFDGSSGP